MWIVTITTQYQNHPPRWKISSSLGLISCGLPIHLWWGQGLPSELDDNLFLAGGGAVTKERGEEGEECAGGQGGRGRIRVEGVGRGGRMRRRRGAGSAREAAHKGRRRKGRNGGQGGVETGERESPWAMYQRFMSERYEVIRWSSEAPILRQSLSASLVFCQFGETVFRGGH